MNALNCYIKRSAVNLVGEESAQGEMGIFGEQATSLLFWKYKCIVRLVLFSFYCRFYEKEEFFLMFDQVCIQLSTHTIPHKSIIKQARSLETPPITYSKVSEEDYCYTQFTLCTTRNVILNFIWFSVPFRIQ